MRAYAVAPATPAPPFPDSASPPSASLLAELELRSHFSGKRAGDRVECGLAVDVKGSGGWFRACLADISPSGALLELVGPPFAEATAADDFLGFMAHVEREFGAGMRIAFVDVRGRIRASVVRIAQTPEEDGGALLVACRFHRALPRRLRRMVGLGRGDGR